MKKIKIITDSTAYIRKDYMEREDITIVPLNYVFGEESKKEESPGEFDEFFNKLERTDLFPTTSQPSAGEFLDAFNDALENYDEIIAILLSSKLSGTYNSALLAKNMLEDKSITIIDSETSASNLRFLVEEAVNMAREGKTSKEIESHINSKKVNMNVYLTTETLEYLSRGGRLSTIQSTIGNLLNIKPILALSNGELKLDEKIRGKKKALSTMIDKIPSNIQRIGICHILNEEDAGILKDTLEEKFPKAIVEIDELGPVIGAHLGPKALGICLY